jgi:microsomal epoxide hydrolase
MVVPYRRDIEERINSFPNFKMPVEHNGDTYYMHFTALFSANPSAVPVMMLHGWPGSFLEFLPILRLLTKKYTRETLPYHVVIPSLPGYTLSSPPPKDKDFKIQDAATILDNLMRQLGFEESGYVVQGGDVGSKLARVLGGTTNNVARAVHLNFCIMPDPVNIPESI